MSISSRWAVVTDYTVGPEDRGANRAITEAAVDQWATGATSAYLRQCPKLESRRAGAGLVLRTRVAPHAGGAKLGDATSVAVSGTATEVFPQAFVIAVRIRPLGGESTDPLDLTCEIRLEDPVTGATQDIGNDIRDELIAIEHAARHFN